MIAAPAAAATPGPGTVMTGTRNCSDSRWAITGIAAAPPTVAIAARFATGIRLRSNTSANASMKSENGPARMLSTSALVSATSAR